MEICNSYSSSSVDSTKHSASESSVNLSLSLTFPSTSPQRSSSPYNSVFHLFCFCSVFFSSHCLFVCRATKQDWPPIKPRLRDTLKVRRRLLQRDYDTCLFVKVYMEGVPIGRKLDLSTFSGYESLLESLSQMFNTSIICK